MIRWLNRLRQRNKLICFWLVRLAPAERFQFQGKTYSYFRHRYNTTWRNERAVEIPIVREFIRAAAGKRILEVGNVLSHYGITDHDVLDRYERAEGVINEDVCSFRSEKKYDLIVSISTLEHVGWDEEPRDPARSLQAIENLCRLAAPGGRIVITVPLGYNPEMDRLIREEKAGFTHQYFLKRYPRWNQWREASLAEVQNAQYGLNEFTAHELAIGIIERH